MLNKVLYLSNNFSISDAPYSIGQLVIQKEDITYVIIKQECVSMIQIAEGCV